MNRRSFALCAALPLACGAASRATAHVVTSVTCDAATGLYTCAHAVIAGARNRQEFDSLHMPSFHQIEPDRTLGGFSLRSPDPPAPGNVLIGAFEQIPMEGVDFAPGMSPTLPDDAGKLTASQARVPRRRDGTADACARPSTTGTP